MKVLRHKDLFNIVEALPSTPPDPTKMDWTQDSSYWIFHFTQGTDFKPTSTCLHVCHRIDNKCTLSLRYGDPMTGRGPKEQTEGPWCLVSLDSVKHGGLPRNLVPDREK